MQPPMISTSRYRMSLLRKFAMIAGFSASLLGVTLAGAEETTPSAAGSITMDGRGSVSVAPDMAVISTSVVSTAKTASDALAQNTDAIARVIGIIKAEGVDKKDIQTSGFGIYPRYDHKNTSTGNQPLIVGYEVRNGVEVNVRDLDKLGALLTLVVESGANSVGGIRFEVSDPQEKLDEARRKAVEAARHKAEIFANAAGVDLGDILTIAETGAHIPRPVMMAAESRMMAAASVPIEAGEETISASVTIRWELK